MSPLGWTITRLLRAELICTNWWAAIVRRGIDMDYDVGSAPAPRLCGCASRLTCEVMIFSMNSFGSVFVFLFHAHSQPHQHTHPSDPSPWSETRISKRVFLEYFQWKKKIERRKSLKRLTRELVALSQRWSLACVSRVLHTEADWVRRKKLYHDVDIFVVLLFSLMKITTILINEEWIGKKLERRGAFQSSQTSSSPCGLGGISIIRQESSNGYRPSPSPTDRSQLIDTNLAGIPQKLTPHLLTIATPSKEVI